jgi:hypothetical protein
MNIKEGESSRDHTQIIQPGEMEFQDILNSDLNANMSTSSFPLDQHQIEDPMILKMNFMLNTQPSMVDTSQFTNAHNQSFLNNLHNQSLSSIS